MEENQASQMAQRAALKRAAHQILDDPKVFDDPLALRMLGPVDAAALQANPRQFEGSRLAPFLRAFMAVRSRYAEDELALAVARGVRQYVILGAGLDTFAWRNPYHAGALRVFEVDHPASQAWKRARLKEAGLALPRDLFFAPVDFQDQTLAEGLRGAGHDPGQPTFFSWLGVTPYLTPEAVMGTLRFIVAAPAGSGVVFDYALAPALLSEAGRQAFAALAQRADAAGETWQAFFEPAVLGEDLRAMGFRQVEDLGSTEINARYFKGRKDSLRVGSSFHLLSAQV